MSPALKRVETAALLLIFACRDAAGPVLDIPPEADRTRTTGDLTKRVRPVMGTYVELSLPGIPEAEANVAAEAVFAEFDRIDRSMSEWKTGSQLSAVNAGAGLRAVEVDQELFDLLSRALALSRLTDGAFDPTFASMWGLWTFGDDGVRRPPAREEVERRRPLIDWRKVTLDPARRTVFLHTAGMKLGLGGIAKGYATDRAAALLRARGVESFLIKAGGELFAAGTKGGRPWRVGLRDPRGEGSFAVIDLSDRAFDTSGDYERFFMADGVRYHHIIDPASGYPATASRSATVLAEDATTADALSTALFVMGPERGMALVESLPGVEAVIVGADNQVVLSTGLAGRLLIQRSPTP